MDVKPADVNRVAREIEAQVRDLATSYGVGHVPPAALPSGKRPGDVYANLVRLSLSLDALGVPATVPNDVYRVAATLKAALVELAQAAGASIPATAAVADRPKTPGDVYQVGLSLIEDLMQVSDANQSMAVPGGISVPAAKDGRIVPADVNRLLLRILADVDAMKFAMGLRTASPKPPMEGGKTPTDVWLVLMDCRAITDAIRNL